MSTVSQAVRVLTNHGYSVLKSSLTPDQERSICKDLTVKPTTSDRFGAMKDNEFPVYLESSARLYLPRVWATERLGAPEESVVGEGLPLPAR